MSIQEVTFYSVARCLLLLVLVLPIGFYFSRFMNRLKGKEKIWLWGILCFPVFVPELLAGYSYANFSLNLVQWSWLNEVLYFLLLFIKVLPVSVIIFYLSPPPEISESALYCEDLLKRNSFVKKQNVYHKWLGIYKGYQTQVLFVFAVTFLYAFQEFQVASLLGFTYQNRHYPASWPVWLFDAQSTGMLHSETMKRMVFPLLCEIVVVIPLIFVMVKFSGNPARSQSYSCPFSKSARKWIIGYGILSLICFVLIPFFVIGSEFAVGWKTILQNSKYFTEILTGLSLSLVASVITVLLSSRLSLYLIKKKKNKFSGVYLALLMLPGFFGSLILSLSMFDVFQGELFSRFLDTLIPYFVAMLFFLLPRILILQILFLIREKRESYALIEMMNTNLSSYRSNVQNLKWHLKYRHQFWLVCLGSMWGYWDLTISSILLPARYSTATVRLYNLMHYGRSETLSAMLVFAIIIPVVVIALFYFLRKPALRIINSYV
jgi:iron(III) transport system permease protein